VKRALGLSACFVAGLALFAVGGVAGAADGPTTSSTPTTTTAPTSTVSPTTTAATTATTAAATTVPQTTTAAATTTAATTTTAAAPAPAPELPWWIQLLLGRRRQPSPAPTTTTAKVTTSSSSTAKGGSSSSSSSSSAATAPAAAAAPAEEAVVQPPPPPPAPARLVVAAHATQGDLTVGSTLTVTYTVQNTGGRAASALLTDALPAALAPIYVDSDQGACTGDRTVRCALGPLGPGRSADVTLVLQVTKAATFVNAADADAADDAVAVGDPASLRFTAGTGAAVRLGLPR
jgi:hypothetical protein